MADEDEIPTGDESEDDFPPEDSSEDDSDE